MRQRGLSLLELVVFVVAVGIAVAGVTAIYNTVVRGSADPMLRKQALSIAEALLREIEQQAFTWCDPQDDNVTTAQNAAVCALAANDQTVLAPTAGETRGDAEYPFDNVADYNGYAASGSDIVGGGATADYAVSVAISAAGGAGAFATLPANAVLKIAVTVAGRGQSVTLVGYRTRYAPNAPG